MIFGEKEDHSLLTHTCIGATICIVQEIQCLPYAEFFFILMFVLALNFIRLDSRNRNAY